MDKSYPTKPPMVVKSLDVEKILLDHGKKEKRYWGHMTHILVPLEH
jgi:hypothetical protein